MHLSSLLPRHSQHQLCDLPSAAPTRPPPAKSVPFPDCLWFQATFLLSDKASFLILAFTRSAQNPAKRADAKTSSAPYSLLAHLPHDLLSSLLQELQPWFLFFRLSPLFPGSLSSRSTPVGTPESRPPPYTLPARSASSSHVPVTNPAPFPTPTVLQQPHHRERPPSYTVTSAKPRAHIPGDTCHLCSIHSPPLYKHKFETFAFSSNGQNLPQPICTGDLTALLSLYVEALIVLR